MSKQTVHAGAVKKTLKTVPKGGEGVGGCGGACHNGIDTSGNPCVDCDARQCQEGRAVASVTIDSNATFDAYADILVTVDNTRLGGGYLYPNRMRIYARRADGTAAIETGDISNIVIGGQPQEKVDAAEQIPIEEFATLGCCDGDGKVCWSWIGHDEEDGMRARIHNPLGLDGGNPIPVRYTVVIYGTIVKCPPEGWLCGFPPMLGNTAARGDGGRASSGRGR